jgi:hypothetical protein
VTQDTPPSFAELLAEDEAAPPSRDGTVKWMFDHPEIAAEAATSFAGGVKLMRIYRVLSRLGYPYKAGAFFNYARDVWR